MENTERSSEILVHRPEEIEELVKWEVDPSSDTEMPLLRVRVAGHILTITNNPGRPEEKNSGVSVAFRDLSDPRFPKGKTPKFRELPEYIKGITDPDTRLPIFNSDGIAFKMDLDRVHKLIQILIDNPKR